MDASADDRAKARDVFPPVKCSGDGMGNLPRSESWFEVLFCFVGIFICLVMLEI